MFYENGGLRRKAFGGENVGRAIFETGKLHPLFGEATSGVVI
jgi:hypothetical protein